MSDAPRDTRWNEADPELPSELGDLLRGGRDRLGTPEEVAELGRRLCAALGPAAGLTSDGQPAPASGTAGTTARSPGGVSAVGAASRGIWAVAGAGALLAIGVAAFVFLRSPNTPVSPASPPAPVLETASSAAPGNPASAASPPAATAAPAPPPAADEVDPAAGAMTEPPAASSAAVPPAKARPLAAPRRAGNETALLEQARAALHKHPAQALALTRRHQARFPRGVLAQEREVIAIEALERLGRKDAANARAAEFERRFRGSVHQPRLLRGTDTSAPGGGDSNTTPP